MTEYNANKLRALRRVGQGEVMSNTEPLSGIDLLRLAVSLFNNGNESFNQEFTATELLRIAAAWRESYWDIHPDKWTWKQLINTRKRGRVPDWVDESTPKDRDLAELSGCKLIKQPL